MLHTAICQFGMTRQVNRCIQVGHAGVCMLLPVASLGCHSLPLTSCQMSCQKRNSTALGLATHADVANRHDLLGIAGNQCHSNVELAKYEKAVLLQHKLNQAHSQHEGQCNTARHEWGTGTAIMSQAQRFYYHVADMV